MRIVSRSDEAADAFELAQLTATPEQLRKSVDRRSVRYVVGRLLGNPSSIIGTFLIVGFSFVALAAPILAPCPQDQKITCRIDSYRVPKYGFKKIPQLPSTEHRFGTTPDQYDIYYAVVWGARTAFKAGVVIVLLSLVIGLTVGSVAAYYGGWIDEVVMRFVEIFQAFPYFLAAITLATVLRSGGGASSFKALLGENTVAPAIIALVAFGWMGYARLVRADILSIKERDFVTASRSLGMSDAGIILRHVLPNSIFPVLVVASLDIGTIVQSFAGLSFFGLGVPHGYADWGQMIAGARTQITSAAFARSNSSSSASDRHPSSTAIGTAVHERSVAVFASASSPPGAIGCSHSSRPLAAGPVRNAIASSKVQPPFASTRRETPSPAVALTAMARSLSPAAPVPTLSFSVR